MGHSGEEAVAAASGARLEAVSGPLKGKLFPLTRDEVLIGRDPSNEISLLDSLVSRRHCVIRQEANNFRLQDLDSRNNTFVGGVPVRERVLVHGDQIRIGNSILIFHRGRPLEDEIEFPNPDLVPVTNPLPLTVPRDEVFLRLFPDPEAGSSSLPGGSTQWRRDTEKSSRQDPLDGSRPIKPHPGSMGTAFP